MIADLAPTPVILDNLLAVGRKANFKGNYAKVTQSVGQVIAASLIQARNGAENRLLEAETARKLPIRSSFSLSLDYLTDALGDAGLMKKTCLILTLTVLVLAACTATSAPPAVDTVPAPAATVAIAAAPTSAPPVGVDTSTPAPDDACPAAKDGFNLHIAEEDDYCLLYPAEAVVVPKRFIVINPASATADSLGDAWVDIQVESASGRSATQVADARIAEAGEGFNIARSEILLGGQQAVVVDGLPGPDSWRTVFVVDNDRLYTLTFQPWFPSGDPDRLTPLETLYATIVDTFRFMP